jgi:hypothetical protein
MGIAAKVQGQLRGVIIMRAVGKTDRVREGASCVVGQVYIAWGIRRSRATLGETHHRLTAGAGNYLGFPPAVRSTGKERLCLQAGAEEIDPQVAVYDADNINIAGDIVSNCNTRGSPEPFGQPGCILKICIQ